MGRLPPADATGDIYYALNRGNAKNPIFFKDAYYEAFEKESKRYLTSFTIADTLCRCSGTRGA